jgi:hypothetical protein
MPHSTSVKVIVPHYPLTAPAEQVLAELLACELPTAGVGEGEWLPAVLYEPVVRRILNFLEGPGGSPSRDDAQRVGDYALDLACNFDRLRFGTGTTEVLSRLLFERIEGLAVLSFTLGGVPFFDTGIHLDASRLATRLAQARAASTSTPDREIRGAPRDAPVQLTLFEACDREEGITVAQKGKNNG